MADSGIGAFARAFGDAFSETHNRRIQQQIAIQAQQNAAIGETLVKSVIETPDLYQNKTFKKAFDDVVGKDNAAGIVEAAVAFQNSPMGMIHQAVRSNLTGAVSAEANGPGTGPSVPFSEIPQHPDLPDQMSVLADRFHNLRSDVVGAGVDANTGQLHAQQEKRDITPSLNAEGLTPAQAAALKLQEEKFAEQKRQFGITTGQKERDVQGRSAMRGFVTRKGERFDALVELPDGNQIPVTKRRYSPDGGKTIMEEVVTAKRKPLESAPAESLASISTALRIEDELEDLYTNYGPQIRAAFTPFYGRPLAEAEAKLGTLTGPATQFVKKLAALRLARSNASGGKAITGTELQAIDATLPTASTMFEQFLPIVQASREVLTGMGADIENIAEGTGRIAPRIYVSKRNKDYYKHVRRKRPSIDLSPKVIAQSTDTGEVAPAETDLETFNLLMGDE